MYQLEKPIFFYLLFAIVGLMVIFLLVFIWKKHTQNKFAHSKALRLLSPNRSFFKSWIKVIILSLAIASLALALVNPKIGTKIETISRAGVDVVFALDVSKSMLAEDIAPNRLDKSKQLITQIINSLGGDRVGIIGYAGSAFPQVPITTDFSTTKLFLNTIPTTVYTVMLIFTIQFIGKGFKQLYIRRYSQDGQLVKMCNITSTIGRITSEGQT